MWLAPAVTGRMAIVRIAEIVAGAAAGRAAAGGIVDAAGAADVPVAAAGGIGGVAGLVGDDTRSFCHGFARMFTDRDGHGESRGPFYAR
jgi:hypothetical protein